MPLPLGFRVGSLDAKHQLTEREGEKCSWIPCSLLHPSFQTSKAHCDFLLQGVDLVQEILPLHTVSSTSLRGTAIDCLVLPNPALSCCN